MNLTTQLSQMYTEEDFSFGKVVDLREIQQTNCYCSPESEQVLRAALSACSHSGIHFIDSGDYHYLTLFFLEKIKEPFNLVLIDNHPDDQDGAFDKGLLSCGNWVKAARKNIGFLKKDYHISRADEILFSETPVYISLDMDILSKECFSTDWDQGEMSIEELTDLLKRILAGTRVLGIDICGGRTQEKGARSCELTHNKSVREYFIQILSGFNQD